MRTALYLGALHLNGDLIRPFIVPGIRLGGDMRRHGAVPRGRRAELGPWRDGGEESAPGDDGPHTGGDGSDDIFHPTMIMIMRDGLALHCTGKYHHLQRPHDQDHLVGGQEGRQGSSLCERRGRRLAGVAGGTARATESGLGQEVGLCHLSQ